MFFPFEVLSLCSLYFCASLKFLCFLEVGLCRFSVVFLSQFCIFIVLKSLKWRQHSLTSTSWLFADSGPPHLLIFAFTHTMLIISSTNTDAIVISFFFHVWIVTCTCVHTHTLLHVTSASLILSSCFFGGRRVNSGGAERNNSRSALSRCPGVTSLTGSAGAVASPPLCGVQVWINPTESERSYYLSSVVSASLLVNLRSS